MKGVPSSFRAVQPAIARSGPPRFVPPARRPSSAAPEWSMHLERSPLPWFRAATLALVLALGAPVAQAATIIARSDAELTERSDAVVVAEVERVASELDADGNVRTRNTLTVEEWWTGSGPARIDVLQSGGTWQGRRSMVHGDFALEEGQRAVLFLRKGPDGWYSTLLSWSVFDVQGAGITARVQRQGQDLELKERGEDGRLRDTVAEDGGVKSLGGLKADVQRAGRKGAQR